MNVLGRYANELNSLIAVMSYQTSQPLSDQINELLLDDEMDASPASVMREIA
jgi:hypothetical protein